MAITALPLYGQSPICGTPIDPCSHTMSSVVVKDIIAFNDDYGNAPLPTEYPQTGAIAAGVSDFDHDGVRDVVIGANQGMGGNAVVVRYLSYLHGSWPIAANELLPSMFGSDSTSSCYDIDVGDLNGDGWDDIVVARLNDNDDFYFINSGNPQQFGQRFGPNTDEKLVVPSPASGSRSSFGVDLADVDCDGDLDAVFSGANYGLRYFRWDPVVGGASILAYVKQYLDVDYPGAPKYSYRDVILEDFDGDGDPDMAVTRALADFPDRIWFNGTHGACGPASDPFVISDQPIDLVRAPGLGYDWRTTGGMQAGTCCPGAISFEVAASDLDGDGDKDLVISSPTGSNVAYLNNGQGYFGHFNNGGLMPLPPPPGAPPTCQTPVLPNDGLPAFVFPSVTEQWPPLSASFSHATSECLYVLCSLSDPNFPPTGVTSYSQVEFRCPGGLLNVCTGVDLFDVDGDGRVDVGFSNRNDIQEICTLPSAGVPSLAYLNPLGDPFYSDPVNPDYAVPDVYDYVFYNDTAQASQSSFAGSLKFRECVEKVGIANDGTGYAEIANLGDWFGSPRVPEWIDANFSNDVHDGAGEGPNAIYWGLGLVSGDCALGSLGSGPEGLIASEAELRLDFGPAMSGMCFIVIATGTGEGEFNVLDGNVPIVADALTEVLAGAPGTVGTLGSLGAATVHVSVPMDESLLKENVWLVGVALDGPSIKAVTNVVRLPVKSSGG